MSDYKPAFLNEEKSPNRHGRGSAESVGLPEHITNMLRNQVSIDGRITQLVGNDQLMLTREKAYRKLTIDELRSLALERHVHLARTGTPGTLVYELLGQDNLLIESNDRENLGQLYPSKITYKHHSMEEFMATEEATKKEKKSRVRAGKSAATEELFKGMAEMFPNALSQMQDPRYSLIRSKKIDQEIIDHLKKAGVELKMNGAYLVFYATERQVEGKQEIFLRFMSRTGLQEDNGKFTGTSEQCMKKYRQWANEIGLKVIDKYFADKKAKAKEPKEKPAKTTGGGEPDPGKPPVEASKKNAKK